MKQEYNGKITFNNTKAVSSQASKTIHTHTHKVCTEEDDALSFDHLTIEHRSEAL